MTPTFVDAGVLIAAACGVPDISEPAMRILDDPDRRFVTSALVRLEVIPKPSYHGFCHQIAFYEAFFACARFVPVSKKLLDEALLLACQFGLGACDAVHLASAQRGKCMEFITTEKRSRPLFRAAGTAVISLQA